jgi:hypothetical protein
LVWRPGLVVKGRPSLAIAWISALAGLWVAVAPFVLGYVGWQGVDHTLFVLGYSAVAAAVVNDVISGLVVLVLSVIRALSARAQRGPEPASLPPDDGSAVF